MAEAIYQSIEPRTHFLTESSQHEVKVQEGEREFSSHFTKFKVTISEKNTQRSQELEFYFRKNDQGFQSAPKSHFNSLLTRVSGGRWAIGKERCSDVAEAAKQFCDFTKQNPEATYSVLVNTCTKNQSSSKDNPCYGAIGQFEINGTNGVMPHYEVLGGRNYHVLEKIKSSLEQNLGYSAPRSPKHAPGGSSMPLSSSKTSSTAPTSKLARRGEQVSSLHAKPQAVNDSRNQQKEVQSEIQALKAKSAPRSTRLKADLEQIWSNAKPRSKS
ncbi:hypothetical protein JQC92_09820 [Shewanella sp. 202IG2-18]|uniref:hypothetical protein n=1 Tax=Parashewanella hymeniacidonis TaxID=2807618 RepID=UPI00196054E6|nr:hypothetical protein [Parashewanella hymeniacidonis]MBM7072325.1 hypothetical protein [Parashewanella hymeniacidonis]